MIGHFKLELKASRDLRDEDFRAAARAGELDALLRGLPTERKAEGENLIFNWFAVYQFVNLMSGAGYAQIALNSSAAAFAHLNLCTLDAEPTYTEWTEQYYGGPSTQPNTAGAGAKRFIEDHIEAHQIQCAPDGREEITLRERWLFLPSEGVSSDIRSLAVYFRLDGDYLYESYTYRFARIRLKNQAGLPIIINKTNRHVLLVEYVATLVTV
jgi:hypothetical protein